MLYNQLTPFADMFALQRDMSKFMNRVFGPVERGMFTGGKTAWMPPIESFYTGKDLIVRAWIPGVEASEVDVHVSGNLLSIKGERKMTHEVPEDQYLFSEVAYGPFERTVTLPEGLKFEQVRPSTSSAYSRSPCRSTKACCRRRYRSRWHRRRARS